MSCKDLSDKLKAVPECGECPAGLSNKITIGWVGGDGEIKDPKEFELDKMLHVSNNKDGFPISLPANDKAWKMLDEIKEQLNNGNKIENLRVIIESDGPRLDPETMI